MPTETATAFSPPQVKAVPPSVAGSEMPRGLQLQQDDADVHCPFYVLLRLDHVQWHE